MTVKKTGVLKPMAASRRAGAAAHGRLGICAGQTAVFAKGILDKYTKILNYQFDWNALVFLEREAGSEMERQPAAQVILMTCRLLSYLVRNVTQVNLFSNTAAFLGRQLTVQMERNLFMLQESSPKAYRELERYYKEYRELERYYKECRELAGYYEEYRKLAGTSAAKGLEVSLKAAPEPEIQDPGSPEERSRKVREIQHRLQKQIGELEAAQKQIFSVAKTAGEAGGSGRAVTRNSYRMPFSLTHSFFANLNHCIEENRFQNYRRRWQIENERQIRQYELKCHMQLFLKEQDLCRQEEQLAGMIRQYGKESLRQYLQEADAEVFECVLPVLSILTGKAASDTARLSQNVLQKLPGSGYHLRQPDGNHAQMAGQPEKEDQENRLLAEYRQAEAEISLILSKSDEITKNVLLEKTEEYRELFYRYIRSEDLAHQPAGASEENPEIFSDAEIAVLLNRNDSIREYPKKIQTEKIQTGKNQTGKIQTGKIQTEGIRTEGTQAEEIQTEGIQAGNILAKREILERKLNLLSFREISERFLQEESTFLQKEVLEQILGRLEHVSFSTFGNGEQGEASVSVSGNRGQREASVWLSGKEQNQREASVWLSGNKEQNQREASVSVSGNGEQGEASVSVSGNRGQREVFVSLSGNGGQREASVSLSGNKEQNQTVLQNLEYEFMETADTAASTVGKERQTDDAVTDIRRVFEQGSLIQRKLYYLSMVRAVDEMLIEEQEKAEGQPADIRQLVQWKEQLQEADAQADSAAGDWRFLLTKEAGRKLLHLVSRSPGQEQARFSQRVQQTVMNFYLKAANWHDVLSDTVTGTSANIVTGVLSDTVKDTSADTVTGARSGTVTGTSADTVTGASADTVTGARSGTVTGASADTVIGARSGTVTGTSADTVTGALSDTVADTLSETVTGALSDAVKDTLSDAVTGTLTDAAFWMEWSGVFDQEEWEQLQKLAKTELAERKSKMRSQALREWQGLFNKEELDALAKGNLIQKDPGGETDMEKRPYRRDLQEQDLSRLMETAGLLERRLLHLSMHQAVNELLTEQDRHDETGHAALVQLKRKLEEKEGTDSGLPQMIRRMAVPMQNRIKESVRDIITQFLRQQNLETDPKTMQIHSQLLNPETMQMHSQLLNPKTMQTHSRLLDEWTRFFQQEELEVLAEGNLIQKDSGAGRHLQGHWLAGRMETASLTERKLLYLSAVHVTDGLLAQNGGNDREAYRQLDRLKKELQRPQDLWNAGAQGWDFLQDSDWNGRMIYLIQQMPASVQEDLTEGVENDIALFQRQSGMLQYIRTQPPDTARPYSGAAAEILQRHIRAQEPETVQQYNETAKTRYPHKQSQEPETAQQYSEAAKVWHPHKQSQELETAQQYSEAAKAWHPHKQSQELDTAQQYSETAKAWYPHKQSQELAAQQYSEAAKAVHPHNQPWPPETVRQNNAMAADALQYHVQGQEAETQGNSSAVHKALQRHIRAQEMGTEQQYYGMAPEAVRQYVTVPRPEAVPQHSGIWTAARWQRDHERLEILLQDIDTLQQKDKGIRGFSLLQETDTAVRRQRADYSHYRKILQENRNIVQEASDMGLKIRSPQKFMQPPEPGETGPHSAAQNGRMTEQAPFPAQNGRMTEQVPFPAQSGRMTGQASFPAQAAADRQNREQFFNISAQPQQSGEQVFAQPAGQHRKSGEQAGREESRKLQQLEGELLDYKNELRIRSDQLEQMEKKIVSQEKEIRVIQQSQHTVSKKAKSAMERRKVLDQIKNEIQMERMRTGRT